MLSPLWKPSETFKKTSNLVDYTNWLRSRHRLDFSSYDALWAWSVKNDVQFWQTIVEYFKVQYSGDYKEVRTDNPMPDTEWFKGMSLNYARHIFRKSNDRFPAIIEVSESGKQRWITWRELEEKVGSVAQWMRNKGVRQGDRVAAYLPNIAEATIAFLATNSIGAVWSSCSPDFGVSSVIDRFKQIEPVVLFVVDGYRYNNKTYDRQKEVEAMLEELESVKLVVTIPTIEEAAGEDSFSWEELINTPSEGLEFTDVPFDHPIWVLYSSGTTGIPKAITHGHGGVLLEHLKYLSFHNNVKPGERFFWYTTTGWMMWNYVQAALLCGASIVLYDGSPAYPDMGRLWKLTDEIGIHHFGTSAPFLIAAMKAPTKPTLGTHLQSLRSISSTGAPLPAEAFDWVYSEVVGDVWLVSMSGGTDVCTAFIGGVPTEPVYAGEIQKRALGVALFALDEKGHEIEDEVGEMVITKPMPSMPIYFWNDRDKSRYKASYFEMYPGGIWRHGDWIKITSRGSLIVYGRSDATLNRHGIRIGTAEIYRSLDQLSAVKDALIVNLEFEDGGHFMPLFVVMNPGHSLNKETENEICRQIRSDYTPRHVPDALVETPDIPYTISGKKLEAPVKKILMGIPVDRAANLGAVRNPQSLRFFIDYGAKLLSSR